MQATTDTRDAIICSRHPLGILDASTLGISYESDRCPLCATERALEALHRLQRARASTAQRCDEAAQKLDLRWREADAMASALERHGAGASVHVLETGIRSKQHIHSKLRSKLSKIEVRVRRASQELERLQQVVENATHCVIVELARITLSSPNEESVRRAISKGRTGDAVRITAHLLIEASDDEIERRIMVEENLPTIEAAYKLSMKGSAETHGDEASTSGLSEVE